MPTEACFFMSVFTLSIFRFHNCKLLNLHSPEINLSDEEPLHRKKTR